jgi:hypothetical protein
MLAAIVRDPFGFDRGAAIFLCFLLLLGFRPPSRAPAPLCSQQLASRATTARI